MKRLMFLFICWLAVNTQVQAQLFVQGGATVHVSNDALLTTSGGIHNTGTIHNFGNVAVYGDFENTNQFLSTGSLSLMGINQNVTHSNAALSTLSIMGGGIKTLKTDMTIDKKLNLSNGLLKPEAGKKLQLTKSAASDLGNASSYVDGMLYREGDTNLYYPIGKSNEFMPAEFQSIEGSPVLGVELMNPTDVKMIPGKGCRNLLKTRYYKTEVLSGALTKAFVALPYFDTDDLIQTMEVGIAQGENPEGPYELLKKEPTKTSTIFEAGIDKYSVSQKPGTMKYFALSNYINADMTLFYLPNALSHHAPGADDQSVKVYGDVFDAKGFLFTVSNQWGNLIYKTTSLDEMITHGWAGINSRTKRKEVTGQYHFLLKAITLDGDNYEKAGSIWIID